MNRCPDLAEWEALLGGRASDTQTETLRAHLADCPTCREICDDVTQNERYVHPLRLAVRYDDTIAAAVVAGQRIGPYRILALLGEGGMGVVYLAEQTEPIHRRAALKIVKLGMDTRHVIARFETERGALAIMNHPNVAKVFDAGATEQGRPYFVMEYVPGVPITEHCDKHRLTIHERLTLFMDVCHAVQHAHQKGIIHRDIKPSNVLVAVEDDRPVPKVIDFGVAKATQHRLTDRTLFTAHNQLIGTPDYMSPEQAKITALDIDTRTDIYSLGVLLYELLAGETPFDFKARRQTGLAELQQMICERNAPKPSVKISSLGALCAAVAETRRMEPRRLAHELRGDLDWIVMKCLEKERKRRYETANALAVDIQRYLNHEPVLARAPSIPYRFRKFVRRNQRAVAAVASLFVMLTGGVVISTAMYLRAERARLQALEAEAIAQERLEDTMIAQSKADAAREEAEAVTSVLEDMFNVEPSGEGKEVTLLQALDDTAATLGERLAHRPAIEARLRRATASIYHRLGRYQSAATEWKRLAVLTAAEFGEKDRRTLSAVGNMALALREQGHYDESEAKFRATLEFQRSLFGEQHQDTLRTMSDLANALLGNGYFAEAAELHQKALGERSRLLGEEHHETLASMTNLGITLERQGRYFEAEILHKEALEILRRVEGEKDRQTLNTMNNLANAIHGQGRYLEAEAIHRKNLESKRIILLEEHPSILGSMSNVANAVASQGRYREAEALHREILESRRRVLGRDHPDTLDSVSELANVGQGGEYAEAEKLLRDSLETRRRRLGEGHPGTLAATRELAVVLDKQGKTEESVEWYGKALDGYGGRAEKPTASAIDFDGLASLLLTCQPSSRRDPHRALELAKRAVELTDARNFAILTTLAQAHQMTGEVDDAVKCQRAALDLLPPEASPDRANLEWKLGEYLREQKNFAEAEPLLLSSYRWMKERWEGDPRRLDELIGCIVALFESREAASPGNGYAARAAEYRKSLVLVPLEHGE